MADSDTTQPDTTQQVTSKTPTTRVKDPKKVAAGQALQRKNREAREAQKKIQEAKEKELFEAKAKIEELERAKALESAKADTPPAENVLTTTQWLSVISIVVSLAGIYYKREEIKGLLTRPQVPPPAPPNTPVDVAPKRGINLMD